MYFGVGLQNQALIVAGKQSRIVSELQVMKSNELHVDQKTYFAKLMLNTVGRKVVYRLYVWAV